MKIFIAGSMQFSEKMLETKDKLEKLGHEIKLSSFVESFLGKDGNAKEELKLEQKNNQDAIKVDCQRIVGNDAILVLNFDKHDIANYIGGNTLIEMGYAHILGLKIFIYNPIPKILFYETEIIAMRPKVLEGNLLKIK